MSLVRHLVVVPLAIPLSVALSPARLEAEASAFGSRLGAVARALDVACVSHPAVTPAPPSSAPAAPLPGPAPRAAHRAKERAHHHRGRPVREGAFAGGIFVGKDTVLRLARAGIIPAARPVRADGGRPGGLLLSGVSALGVGLLDGDILTEVEGIPVASEAQVVGMVIAARSRHAERISAVVWRGAQGREHAHPQAPRETHSGERWSLIVAIPYAF